MKTNSKGEEMTSFEISKPLRSRMNVVATLQEKKMLHWLEERIAEDEKKLGIVIKKEPVSNHDNP